MSVHRPAYQRQVDLPVLARQAKTDSSESNTQTSFPQPTGRVVLSTAFEGPSTCAQNLLTMLPPPSYEVWVNEPVPKANLTVAACQPSEFLESYTSVIIGSSLSSVVPAMTNFACPKNYCTAAASARNYIVCCPSSYQFAPPEVTVDESRPFYGGRCYSDMPSGSTYSILQYNSKGDVASTAISISVTDYQAKAHPIDGFAATSPTALGCSASSSSLRSDTSKSPESSASTTSGASTTTSTAAAESTGVSGGAIAGAVIGGILGLAAIVGLVFFLLRRRKNNTNTDAVPPPPPPKTDDSYARSYTGHVQSPTVSEIDGGGARFAEMGAAMAGSELGYEKKGVYAHHAAVNDGYGAFEMPANQAYEMDAGAFSKHDKK